MLDEAIYVPKAAMLACWSDVIFHMLMESASKVIFIPFT